MKVYWSRLVQESDLTTALACARKGVARMLRGCLCKERSLQIVCGPKGAILNSTLAKFVG